MNDANKKMDTLVDNVTGVPTPAAAPAPAKQVADAKKTHNARHKELQQLIKEGIAPEVADIVVKNPLFGPETKNRFEIQALAIQAALDVIKKQTPTPVAIFGISSAIGSSPDAIKGDEAKEVAKKLVNVRHTEADIDEIVREAGVINNKRQANALNKGL